MISIRYPLFFNSRDVNGDFGMDVGNGSGHTTNIFEDDMIGLGNVRGPNEDYKSEVANVGNRQFSRFILFHLTFSE